MGLALKFISGKYKDGQFPLEEGRIIYVGRSSEVEMVLVEEMVSRKHARLQLLDGVIHVQDLESTNGTFVNGERISSAEIGESDRILIGSNILKVVRLSEGGEEAPTSIMEEPPPTVVPRLSQRRTTGASGESRMSGNLAEIPLPDLLQLFGSSKKSGVLLVESDNLLGRIHLESGLVQHVEIEGEDRRLLSLAPTKAMYRMLGWERGLFELEPPDSSSALDNPMQKTVQELLMDGFREKDELTQLEQRAPSRSDRLLANSQGGKLSELSPMELDTWQLVLRTQNVGETIDQSPYTDLETMQAIVRLVDGGFLSVAT